MVERERFKTLVKGMKAVYVYPSFIPDQDAFNVWYELLKDLSYEDLSAAIQKHMMTSPHPPTIADIREATAQLSSGESEISELKAWDMVRKAISNSIYHAEEEFEKLPAIVQEAVGNCANLRKWASMPTETVESVEQSHFLRVYRVAVDRKKEAVKLAPEIRGLYEFEQNTQPEKIGYTPVTAEITKKEAVPMPDYVKQRMREF